MGTDVAEINRLQVLWQVCPCGTPREQGHAWGVKA